MIRELLDYNAVRTLVPGVPYRRLCQMSDRGEFPVSIRLSSKGGRLWDRIQVDRWIAERLAPIMEEEAA